jgi:hypothetical protein
MGRAVMPKKLVELKSGLSIDRLKGEGASWSPLSIKQHGKALGWLTTFEGVPTLIISPKVKAEMITLPDSGYSALRLVREGARNA